MDVRVSGDIGLLDKLCSAVDASDVVVLAV